MNLHAIMNRSIFLDVYSIKLINMTIATAVISKHTGKTNI